MENKFTPELLEKAKQAKSPEELIALAKESNIELTEEQAKEYLEKLNPKIGELADDELDNVAGGGCVQEAVGSAYDAARDAYDTARDAMSGGSSDRFGIADQVAEAARKLKEGSGTAIGYDTGADTKTGIGTGFNPGVIKK